MVRINSTQCQNWGGGGDIGGSGGQTGVKKSALIHDGTDDRAIGVRYGLVNLRLGYQFPHAITVPLSLLKPHSLLIMYLFILYCL